MDLDSAAGSTSSSKPVVFVRFICAANSDCVSRVSSVVGPCKPAVARQRGSVSAGTTIPVLEYIPESKFLDFEGVEFQKIPTFFIL